MCLSILIILFKFDFRVICFFISGGILFVLQCLIVVFCHHVCIEGNAVICRCHYCKCECDVFSLFEVSGWTDSLERLRRLEHWLVTC